MDYQRHVLILMHPWAGYFSGVLSGIADYLLQRPDWFCTRLLPVPEDIRRLPRIKCDGVIARVEPQLVKMFQRMNVPVVEIANWMTEHPFPRVVVDDAAVGRMAADHLVGLGLKHFGVAGPMRAAFAAIRLAHFENRLAEEGLTASVLSGRRPNDPTGSPPPHGIDARLMNWLVRLPKPAGIFAMTDHVAMVILEACNHLRIRVPEDLCVMGVDDDEMIGRFARPPLTSIAQPTQKIGFEAARLLDRLMDGAAPPQHNILLQPTGLITRQSTNLLMTADKDVKAAISYIYDHVHEGLTVNDLLKVVPLNRRYLERKFRQLLRRTPLQEIQRVRIEMAKKLLATTSLALPAVARRSGYANARRLSEAFRAATGMTPTAFRKQNRNDDTLL